MRVVGLWLASILLAVPLARGDEGVPSTAVDVDGTLFRLISSHEAEKAPSRDRVRVRVGEFTQTAQLQHGAREFLQLLSTLGPTSLYSAGWSTADLEGLASELDLPGGQPARSMLHRLLGREAAPNQSKDLSRLGAPDLRQVVLVDDGQPDKVLVPGQERHIVGLTGRDSGNTEFNDIRRTLASDVKAARAQAREVLVRRNKLIWAAGVIDLAREKMQRGVIREPDLVSAVRKIQPLGEGYGEAHQDVELYERGLRVLRTINPALELATLTEHEGFSPQQMGRLLGTTKRAVKADPTLIFLREFERLGSLRPTRTPGPPRLAPRAGGR